MENVKGFESSNAREPLVSTLTEKGYSCQEFILSPDQVSLSSNSCKTNNFNYEYESIYSLVFFQIYTVMR